MTPFESDLLRSYKSFVYDNPIEEVIVEDLPTVLEWVIRTVEHGPIPYEFEPLLDTAMEKSWGYLDNPDVLAAFVCAALLRIEKDATIFGQRTNGLWARVESPSWEIMRADVSGRRKFFNAVIEIGASSYILRQLAQYGVIDGVDFDWLMEKYEESVGMYRESWARSLLIVFQPENQRHVENIFDARQRDDLLKQVSADWFDAIAIDSDAAEAYRMFKCNTEREALREVERTAANGLTRQEFIRERQEFDGGILDSWWRLSLELGQGDFQANYESDLNALPGWNALEESDHSWFEEAAESYIRKMSPSPERWIHDRAIVFHPDWAGYRAFRYLRTRAPGRLEALSPDVWRLWAPVLVAFPFQSGSEAHAIQRELIQTAYQHAQDAVIYTTIELLRREHPGDIGNMVGLIETCWDERISEGLLEFAKDQKLAVNAFELILSTGVSAGSEIAIGLAAETMEDADAYPAGWKDAATRVLWTYEPERFWGTLWDAVTREDTTRDMVVHSLACAHETREGFVERLSEEHLADLYILLEQEYPQSKDGVGSGQFGEIPARQTIGWFRNGMLNALVSRGTQTGCDQIARIQTRLPEAVWIKWGLQEAHHLLRFRTWAPPSVGEIRSLLRSVDRRLILNGHDLMEVVLESLARLQRRLKENQPPMAVYLWNETPTRPKDEERLSDFIKDHLDADLRARGIIINREVVNRRGDETDIRVETFKLDQSGEKLDLIELVTEVKGRWNAGLKTSMQEQLVDRYMTANSVSQGIYAVGWFESSNWDTNDHRSKKHKSMSLAQAKEFFGSQAASLTSVGRGVREVVLDLSI